MQRVLPAASIKAKIGALAVGLAADCDDPEAAVDKLMREHLPGASTLPFAGFITHDGKWVGGFSGYKDEAAFQTVLTAAAASPLLDATPAVRKQLEKVSAAATAAAERGDWKAVLKAAQQAAKSNGRCPERDAVKAAEARARAWAAEQLDAAAQEARAGGDLAPVRKRLADVRRQFAGEPEADEADVGAKAVRRLTQILDAEKMPNPAHDLREKAAAMFKNSRWAKIFAAPAADDAGGK